MNTSKKSVRDDARRILQRLIRQTEKLVDVWLPRVLDIVECFLLTKHIIERFFL